MYELALFAGAGGGILGTRLLGWRVVCAVEKDAYCREILLRRQEEGHLEPFPIWDDVRTFDGTLWRGSVDVVTAGSRASRSVRLGRIMEKRTTAICGLKPSESYARWDRDTACWKTYQTSLLTNTLEPLSGNFRKAGIAYDGALYQRESWEHPIAEIESGLLPTPRETQSRVPYFRKHRGVGFSRANLEEVLADRYPELIGKRVNRHFINWMMMWPTGWGGLPPVGTAKFQQWLEQHGCS